MKTRPATAALFLSLAATVAGCGESRTDYVNFDQTAPSSMDRQPDGPSAVNNSNDAVVSEKQPLDAKPVSVATASDRATDRTLAVESGAAAETTGPEPPLETTPAAAHGTVSIAQQTTTGKSSAADFSSSVVTTGATSDSNSVSKSGETIPSSSATQVVSSQSGLAGPADNPLIENAAASEPRKIELLIAEKTFRKERGSSAVRVSYDDLDLLKILNMEPVPADAAEYFPEWLRALDGKSVRIRGFMYPTFEATGLTAFTLARDNGICCFVRQPKIYDIIAVGLASGVTSDYIEGRPFDVEGVLRLEPQADEKGLFRLYRIENARVLR